MILSPENSLEPTHNGMQFSRDASSTIIKNYNSFTHDTTDVDLPALAEAIYLLLKEELRLERERLG